MNQGSATIKKNYSRENFIIDQVCDKIEELLFSLDISDFTRHKKLISMACPIHGGDNVSALNIYPDGDEVRGHWMCRTQNCQERYGRDLIGFIRGVLSTQNNREYKWQDARSWLIKLLGYDSIKDIDISCVKDSMSRNRITIGMRRLLPEQRRYKKLYERKEIKRKLVFPCQYYLNRGYSSEVLEKYDVGHSHKLRRVIVPFYDDQHKYCIGWTMRSIYEKHGCGFYHDTLDCCPSTSIEKKNCAKWLTDLMYEGTPVLYNHWFAQDYIKQSKIAIIVEGPGDVWRLEEAGIHNSVAVLGTYLDDQHVNILASCGVLSVILLLDNDKAGRIAKKNISKQLCKIYNIYCPKYSGEDIGENNNFDEIKGLIKEIE